MDKPDWLLAAAAKAAEAHPRACTLVPATVPGRTAHVDGDYLAYRCSGGAECPAGVARANVRDKVQALMEMSGSTQARVHLSMPGGTKGERALVATVKPYQGQRSGAKPLNWEMLRAWLEGYDGDGFSVSRWRDREADDGMALASWQADDPLRTCVIASPDKDMRMLAGLHIDFHDYTLTEVPDGAYEVIGTDGKVYGHKWFWQQTLQGDTADNIPGLPRADGRLCGEKTAARYLDGTTGNEEAFEVVARLYRDYYSEGWADAFVEQAALLWLRGGKPAYLHDFLRVVPRTPEIEAAAKRLIKRVKEIRAEIDSIHAKARAAEAKEDTAG